MERDFLRSRNGRTVFCEDLEMAFDRFAGHGYGVVQVLSGGEATGNVRDFHTPGVVLVTG
jgi:hypothetical protein